VEAIAWVYTRQWMLIPKQDGIEMQRQTDSQTTLTSTKLDQESGFHATSNLNVLPARRLMQNAVRRQKAPDIVTDQAHSGEASRAIAIKGGVRGAAIRGLRVFDSFE
jgi:hypothetical protein